MASIFKTFTAGDVTNTRTLLNEAIPLTGSIASGTYGTWGSEENRKTYSHGMFQSMYDYPYLSSSANQVCDITVGMSNNSALSSSTPGTQQVKKINIYNQMAQVLMGYDHTGSIQEFDQDGNILAGGTKLRECVFLNFARLITKDEIKKGSFTFKIGSNQQFWSANNSTLTITDDGAQNSFYVNSPAGEYGILSASAGEATGCPLNGKCGLVFYQAGIAVITGSVFMGAPTGSAVSDVMMNPVSGTFNSLLTGSSIDTLVDGIRHRWYDLDFVNTTELNSTIYFCRINHNDFNYSSNPTYVSASKIRVKENTTDEPVSYITSVGLYSSDNELLATAKLSEPLKKTPSSELTLRVRIDY